jgi:hypothetical protein
MSFYIGMGARHEAQEHLAERDDVDGIALYGMQRITLIGHSRRGQSDAGPAAHNEPAPDTCGRSFGVIVNKCV